MAQSRHHHKPRRGQAGNPLIEGGEGTYPGPLGGAQPGASESGDLDSREFGVPQADIPGGARHIVNKPVEQAPTVTKPQRPADYHKRHGVPGDDGQYVTPPDESDLGKQRKPEAEPKETDAVPVYMVERPGMRRPLRSLIGGGERVLAANGTDGPIRIADRDPHRAKVWICNESRTGANFVHIGTRDQCDRKISAIGGAGVADVLAIPGALSPQDYATQDELFVCNASNAAITVSWAYEIEIESTGP